MTKEQVIQAAVAAMNRGCCAWITGEAICNRPLGHDGLHATAPLEGDILPSGGG